MKNQNLSKQIENGNYNSHYLIYNRKSTDEPENQKNSIQYQKSENTRFALREHLRIAPVNIEGFCTNGIISEKHSAFKEDSELIIGENGMVQYKIERQKFHTMIDYLNRGFFKGVIILCWDRISRNKGDETIIRKLMKQGVDFRFVLASYDKTSSGALHMDIDGMFAAHHSRVTSEKVSLNIKNQRDKGICTYRAPVGYLNPGTMEHKPFDPVRAPIIRRMFELYATGEYSVSSLTRYAIDQGFTMPPMRRRRTDEELILEAEVDSLIEIEKIERIPIGSVINKILHNKFYTGKVLNNNGGYLKSNSHEPLISEELFERVQQILKKKTVSIHYSDVITYPYRGLIRCYTCMRVYTPYSKKGHQYYRCRCQVNCNNSIKNFNITEIEEMIDKSIASLHFTDEELEQLDLKTTTKITVFNSQRMNQLDEVESSKKRMRENLSYLQNNRLQLLQTGVYTPESYVSEEQKLQNEISDLQTKEQISDEAMKEMVKDIRKLSELLKTLSLQDFTAIPSEKEQIARTIFSELLIQDNTLIYKCNSAFKCFEKRLAPVGDLKGWLSELSIDTADLRKSAWYFECLIDQFNTPLKLAA
ncbi:MAG: recombinase family protein [Bacteroidetes bacterium]|nr:recombinase family protein [Bacteroidota bacterium]